MSTETLLITGATGDTGRHAVQHLREKGHAVRAMVHQEDERSEALRAAGAEIVVGDLLNHDDVIRAIADTGIVTLAANERHCHRSDRTQSVIPRFWIHVSCCQIRKALARKRR
jgi:uncharacterized protein YbjT (DUF2867 family)